MPTVPFHLQNIDAQERSGEAVSEEMGLVDRSSVELSYLVGGLHLPASNFKES